MQKVDRRAPLPGLTALRFFAASYVLLFHLFQVPASALAHPTPLQRLIGAGFSGVSCFFILSGFILAYTHPSVPRPGVFFRARFARIYPLYLLGILLSLPPYFRIASTIGPAREFWTFSADLLLVQGWFPSIATAINTPAWTLSSEAFFYLLFPWIVGQRWPRTRRPILLILLLWLLQVLPPALTNYWLAPRYPSAGPMLHDLLFTPLLRLGEFLAGVVLGFAFLQRQAEGSLAAKPFPRWMLPLSVATCVGALCMNFTLPHEVIRNGLMVGPFCLLIWSLARTDSRFLASRLLQLGGEISYGVYLLQVPATHWAYAVMRRMSLDGFVNRYWSLLVYPFAWFTYLFVEKPCRNWILGRSSKAAYKPIPTPQADLP